MVRREDVEQAVNGVRTRVLSLAEVALHPGQFRAFRKEVLDAFGCNGLGGELDRIFRGSRGHGTEWLGPDHTGQGKGAGMSGPDTRSR